MARKQIWLCRLQDQNAGLVPQTVLGYPRYILIYLLLIILPLNAVYSAELLNKGYII